jgi:hypothetical protein
MKQRLVYLFSTTVALGACLEEDPPATTSQVFFVSPARGDRVGPDFHVELAVTGFTVKPSGVVAPATGYAVLFIDQPCLTAGARLTTTGGWVALSGGELETDLSLDLGTHQLCVQLFDGNGVALAVSQTIEIVVGEVRVRFVKPEYGATHPRRVHFELESDGVVIAPRGEASPGVAHYYLVIDADAPREGTHVGGAPGMVNLIHGESTTEVELQPGWHEVWLGLADGNDVALEPRTRIQFQTY